MNALQVFGFLLSILGAITMFVGNCTDGDATRIIATKNKTIEAQRSVIDIQSRTIELQIQSIDILKQREGIDPSIDTRPGQAIIDPMLGVRR
jgi:hypothetical protein